MVVVKCGASGHNIRSRPGLNAAPVGKLALGNMVTIQEYVSVPFDKVDEQLIFNRVLHSRLLYRRQFVNGEGTWVRMDDESMAKYCFRKGRVAEGEAWSLAVSKHGVTYMKIEQEFENDPMEKRAAAASDPPDSPNHKGFDFSVPSVSHEGFNFTAQNLTPGTADCGEGSNTNPFVFGSYNQHDSPGIIA